MPFRVFAIELGGMKPGRFGLEDAPIEEQVKAANKLKEWLINLGVYVARTKKDMREDMPDLEIEDVPAKIDNVGLYNCIGSKVNTYKKPELPISVMIATRDCLALAKAPHSVELAAPILRSGKKVMIFTAFKAAASHLINGLQQVLDSMGNGGQVGSILGGMHRKTRLEYIQQFKDPNSPVKAMVLMIQAGGTGLDFPNVVDDVIENDFDWTPASNEQMRGRAWRITSKNPVKVKSLVAEGTEDEDFKARVVEKINIADIIIKLTKEQLELFAMPDRYKDEKKLKRMEEIEKEMIDAVKKETELEEGEGRFQQQMADQIREKMGGTIDKSIVAKTKNWYKKSLFKTSYFDRNILNQLNSRLNQQQGTPMLQRMLISEEEKQHISQALSMAKQRLLAELNGPLKQAWQRYSPWEKKNESIMLSFTEKVCGLVKNGGPGVQVQEVNNGIIVPTELYNVLYWRNVVKMLESAIKEQDNITIKRLFPKLAYFCKIF